MYLDVTMSCSEISNSEAGIITPRTPEIISSIMAMRGGPCFPIKTEHPVHSPNYEDLDNSESSPTITTAPPSAGGESVKRVRSQLIKEDLRIKIRTRRPSAEFHGGENKCVNIEEVSNNYLSHYENPTL